MSRKPALWTFGLQSPQAKPFRMFLGDTRRLRVDLNAFLGLKDATVSSAEWASDDGIVFHGDTLSGGIASVLLSATALGPFRGSVRLTLSNGETLVKLWRVFVERPDFDAVIACPPLASPGDGASLLTATTATLTWSPSALAVSYQVFVWETSGEVPTEPTIETQALTADLTDLLPGTEYTWRILAVGLDGSTSEGCGTRTFTTFNPVCPLLTSPADGADAPDPDNETLVWAAAPGAISYNVYVWLSFQTQPDTPTVNTAATSYHITGLNAGATYSWRVDAVYAESTSSGCEIRDFTTAGRIDIQEFFDGGDNTWTKPLDASSDDVVLVELVGGGGGGGGGALNTETVVQGGGGGGGAMPTSFNTTAGALNATEPVYVGFGGTGGAYRTGGTVQNNAIGGQGETSTFASPVVARGYGGGGGAQAGGGGGGTTGAGGNASGTTAGAAGAGGGILGGNSTTGTPADNTTGGGGGGRGGQAGGGGAAIHNGGRSTVGGQGGGGGGGTGVTTPTDGGKGPIYPNTWNAGGNVPLPFPPDLDGKSSTGFATDLRGAGGGGGASVPANPAFDGVTYAAGRGGDGQQPGGAGGGGGAVCYDLSGGDGGVPFQQSRKTGPGGNGGVGFVRVTTFIEP